MTCRAQARTRVDAKDARNVSIVIDARSLANALLMLEYARPRCNAPPGYRWERFNVARAKNSGARVRVTVTWRYRFEVNDLSRLTPGGLLVHQTTTDLIELAG